MKATLFWKYADITGQALMALPIICLASPDSRGTAFLTYFTVGVWQAGSCGLHALAGKKPATHSRSSYARLLAWILGIFAVCSLAALIAGQGAQHSGSMGLQGLFGGILLIEGLILLFAGPVMAVWYATITLEEIRLLKGAIHHRHEIHWKL